MKAVAFHALVWVPVAIAVAIAMDFWAALLHRAMWHGPLWGVHRSHHGARRGRLEQNDALSVLHAPVAIAFVVFGCAGPAGPMREAVFGAGLGMTAFGAAYLIVHDGLVHARLPVRFLLRIPYLRAVAAAHRRHHAGALGGPPYGLFSGPAEVHEALRLTPPTVHRGRRSRSTSPARMPSDRRPKGRGRA